MLVAYILSRPLPPHTVLGLAKIHPLHSPFPRSCLPPLGCFLSSVIKSCMFSVCVHQSGPVCSPGSSPAASLV
ncbi:hypothetical protein TSUD_180460 [Trifolium subterraneum]|uniref:Uncharacterized protein n=1 Tax=Trifolium subterraneum TaxID=3900 RepID=A0A2Z6PCF7_TRISU|nr:hypothetical protein TSUD_180460 [Trifolium subterraneum]